MKSRIALRYWLLGREWERASAAMRYGEAHHNGVRKDGVTPEFDHQIHIAHYLRTMHEKLLFPEDTITAAFLHDVREDYNVPYAEIESFFGERVAQAVDAMTKTFNGAKRSPESVFQAVADDPIASVVKGADRIHNQHTCVGVFTPAKINEYIAETRDYVLPMLREARTKFPTQEPVYENLKFVLTSQMQLLDAVASAATVSV